ncbi:TetR/AcrR family transcriptional regulator [Dyella thiooxydans]|nr:TetR/AcrR family transcriptional regulator [Dyella thiooxydans]
MTDWSVIIKDALRMAPRKVDKQARREDILAAAMGVFATHGYRQTTIDQIADATGISKGAVYLSFASKEDLFYALFEQMTQAAMHLPDASGEGPPASAKAQIQALFDGMLAMIDANEHLIPLTLEFWSACGVEETRERFGGRFAELFGAFRTLLSGLIEQGVQRGEFRDGLPVQALASAVMAMIDGLLLQQWTDPDIRASQITRAALPFLLRALDV